MPIKPFHLLSSAGLLALSFTPALAQNGGGNAPGAPVPAGVPQSGGTAAGEDAPAPANADTGQLEVITVTARKRDESLNSVPIAVTAVTSRTIENAGITSIEKLNTLVPGFTQVQEQDPGTNVITVRGITQVRFGEPPVALVIDGVQTSSPDEGTQDLTDIERIEVLKGPQGATYGRNAIGGAINIVTKLPTNSFENQASAEGGSGGFYSLFGESSGPIVDDKLLYRISASYKSYDGQIRNETLDRKVDNYDTISVRGRLIFKPTDRLTLDLRGHYERLNGGSAYYYPILPGQDINDIYTIVANRAGHGERRLGDVSLKADYEVGTATLTSISAYSHTRAATLGQDLDFLPYPEFPGFGGLTLFQNRVTNAFSQEVRLASASTGRFRWLVGAYYLNTHRDVASVVHLDLGPNTAADAGPILSDLPERNRNNAYAVFANGDYDISNKLKFSLGLRQDWDDRNQTNPLTGSQAHKTFKALQPKASLSYFFTPDQMVYVSAGRGFRSGGFNAQSNLFSREYGAETANTYEAGTKLSLADRHIQLNAAAFYTDQRNVQVYQWDSQSGAQGILTINNAYHYGIESDASARLIGGLRINLGGSLINSKIRDYNGTDLYRGNKLPHVNGFQYNVGMQYDQKLSERLSGTVRVDYSSYGDLYWFIDNAAKQHEVRLVNLHVILERGPWSLTLSAENLFNRRYDTDYFSSFFAGTPTDVGFPNAPRQLDAKIAVRF